ncbi:Ig-like domain-containing protein [Candidatus Ozemobacteraceae bacterium]|nr:Ig-like domain-containing protein [Candidatus Ozemobacteraceae bacterium]
MRKILALLLVTALIPFLTGCRIDGLWGYDDDDSTVTPSVANNLNVALQLPAGFNLNSVRAADAGAGYTVYVKIKTSLLGAVNGWYPLEPKLDAASGKWTFFTTVLTGSDVDLDGTKLQFRIVKNTDPTKEIQFSAGIPTTTTTGTAPQTSEVLIVINTVNVTTTGTTLDIDVFINNDEKTLISTTGIITTTGITSEPGDTNASDATPATDNFAWLTAKFSDGTTWQNFSYDKYTPIAVPGADLMAATFEFTASEALTTPVDEFEVVVTDITSTTGTTLSKANGYLNLEYIAETKTLRVSVARTVTLTANKTYALAITKASAKNPAGKSLALPITGYFKTPLSANATRLTAWPGSDGSTVTPQTTYTLTFNKELKTQLVHATLRFDRFADATSTTPELSSTITVTSNVSNSGSLAINGQELTITLNDPLQANKVYKVYYVSGDILDVDGNPVTVYPNPMIFTTAQ